MSTEDTGTENTEEEVKMVQAGYAFDFNEDDMSDVDADATDQVKTYDDEWAADRVPVAFPDAGEYVVRIYPDRDAKGRMRITRRVWAHRLPGTGGRTFGRRVLQNDVLSKMIEETMEKGWKKAFKYSAMEYGIMMLHIYSAPEDAYAEAGSDVALILDRDQLYNFNTYLSTLTPKDKINLFNPNEEALPLLLTFKGDGFNKELDISVKGKKPVALPQMQLPDGVPWEGLDKIFVTDRDTPTDQDINDLRRTLAQGLQSHNGGSRSQEYNPDKGDEPSFSDEIENAPTTQTPEQGATNEPSQQEAPPEDFECALAEEAQDDPNIIETYGDVGFKNPPKDGNPPQCLMCPQQVACNS